MIMLKDAGNQSIFLVWLWRILGDVFIPRMAGYFWFDYWFNQWSR